MGTPQMSKAVELCRQPFYKDNDREVGLGWDIKDDYYQKDGETLGNCSLIRYSNARQIAVVVLSDHQNSQLVSDVVNFNYEKSGESDQ